MRVGHVSASLIILCSTCAHPQYLFLGQAGFGMPQLALFSLVVQDCNKSCISWPLRVCFEMEYHQEQAVLDISNLEFVTYSNLDIALGVNK